MWFHLLVGPEDRCVFTDSRRNLPWSTSKRTPTWEARPLSWRAYKRGSRGAPEANTNSGSEKGLEPLRGFSLRPGPPLPVCTGAARSPQRCLEKAEWVARARPWWFRLRRGLFFPEGPIWPRATLSRPSVLSEVRRHWLLARCPEACLSGLLEVGQSPTGALGLVPRGQALPAPPYMFLGGGKPLGLSAGGGGHAGVTLPSATIPDPPAEGGPLHPVARIQGLQGATGHGPRSRALPDLRGPSILPTDPRVPPGSCQPASVPGCPDVPRAGSPFPGIWSLSAPTATHPHGARTTPAAMGPGVQPGMGPNWNRSLGSSGWREACRSSPQSCFCPPSHPQVGVGHGQGEAGRPCQPCVPAKPGTECAGQRCRLRLSSCTSHHPAITGPPLTLQAPPPPSGRR